MLEGAKPIDELYLYALPLMWKCLLGRIDGPALTAKPVRYGVGRSRTGDHWASPPAYPGAASYLSVF